MKSYSFFVFIIVAFTTMSQQNEFKTDWANLGKYAADNVRLLSAMTAENRVVFMGNSITEFWRSADSSFFIDNAYIDRGISGQTTPQMLIRFRPDVLELKPKIVVLLAGINDIAENNGPIALSDVSGNIKSMAQLAQANNIKVVLCSVLPAYEFPWRPSIDPREKIILLNQMIQSYCKENELVYVDYYSAMVDEKKGLEKSLSEDGVHPNLKGYKIMEPLVQEAIRNSLKK